MHKFFALFFFLLSVPVSQSQSFDNMAKNTIYLDIGIIFSGSIGAVGIGINYERMVSESISLRAGINIGIFGASSGDNGFEGKGLSFPVTVNYMTKNKNKFEAGIGGGPCFYIGGGRYKSIRFFPAAKLGYRYQPDGESVMFKLGVEVPANFYLSFAGVGYHFK